MSRLLFNKFLHLNNIMLIPRWTSPLLRLFLRPPLLLRLVKVWIQVTRWLRRRRRRQRRRSLISERLNVQLLPPRYLLLINLPTLHGKSSSLACCARETIFFETALAFPRYSKYGPTVAHRCLWLPGVRLGALVRLLRSRVRSPIPVSCVKGTMLFTFVLIWMKPSESWTT